MSKTKSESKWGAFNVSRGNMWGTYVPETGEYYLAHTAQDQVAGECVGVLASACYVRDDEWQEQTECGYSYEVVRELLRLGHLTKKTLEQFIEEGGEVWWNQP